MNFETFVGILRQEETVRSKANKLWRLVSCDLTTTVIRDVDNFRDFTIPTRNFTPEQMTALEALASELSLPVRFAPHIPKE